MSKKFRVTIEFESEEEYQQLYKRLWILQEACENDTAWSSDIDALEEIIDIVYTDCEEE